MTEITGYPNSRICPVQKLFVERESDRCDDDRIVIIIFLSIKTCYIFHINIYGAYSVNLTTHKLNMIFV